MNNPFIYGKLAPKESFCNRTDDKNRIKQNIKNKINTILISPRRWGKSSLVKQVSRENNDKNIRFCFIDLFNIRNEEEFFQTLATEIIKLTSNKIEEWFKTVTEFLSRLNPKINISDDLANLSLQVQIDKKNDHWKDILDLPENLAKRKNIHIVICLDEFQNIQSFSDSLLFQKRLRAQWQHHQHTSYLLYGSKRHMLSELFEKPSMPFYRFGDNFYLQKIPQKEFATFIQRQFNKTGKKISKKQAELICQKMDNHPYYIQQYAHMLWNETSEEVEDSVVEHVAKELTERNSMMYEKDFDSLTLYQINFLRMLINEKEDTQKFSSAIIQKYDLGSSANVNSIISALINKEIIEKFNNRIEFLDPGFKLWLQFTLLK